MPYSTGSTCCTACKAIRCAQKCRMYGESRDALKAAQCAEAARPAAVTSTPREVVRRETLSPRQLAAPEALHVAPPRGQDPAARPVGLAQRQGCTQRDTECVHCGALRCSRKCRDHVAGLQLLELERQRLSASAAAAAAVAVKRPAHDDPVTVRLVGGMDEQGTGEHERKCKHIPALMCMGPWGGGGDSWCEQRQK